MKYINNLHILHQTKFTDSFIKLINDEFDPSEHFFIVYRGGQPPLERVQYPNIWYGKSLLHLFYIVKMMNRSGQIFLHGLNVHKISMITFFQPWLYKKCNWLIWGGDLHFYYNRPGGIYFSVYEYMRKKVIKNLGGIITYAKGDFLLAKKIYHTKATYKECFFYPDALPYTRYKQTEGKGNDKNVPAIMVGNSAAKSNNHKEVFIELAKFAHIDFNVYCPLSYGDSEYAGEVIIAGEKYLKKKFIPVLNDMSLEEYYKFLQTMDVAIFNFNRQQGVGNILTLLYLKKKVFLRPNTEITGLLDDKKIFYFTIDQMEKLLFGSFDEAIAQQNFHLVKTNFSIEKSIKDWGKIFNS